MTQTATALMQRAIDAAVLGVEADPNPRVGCVLTDAGGEVVGVGHHRGAGTPHAEVDALQQAGGAARGGTAWVTLEPCDHTGRTGPCSVALLDAGVARVRYAVPEPWSEAAGGSARLAAAGVDVAVGPLREEAETVNRTWLHARRTGRPFVTWKSASTLDGRSAAADGSSRWVTGEPARADVHALRARCGAVLVGTGTALADDPALTVRDGSGAPSARQPLRVVVGTRRLPADARLHDGTAETLVVPTHDPAAALDAVHATGVHHVLLEGGPTLAAAFLRAGLVDEVVAYVAPALLGGGSPTVGDLGGTSIEDALRLETTDVTVLGGDVRITARPLGRS
ncbi:bifunctional diaminohydroxyphosphoribosylaminopyrimidine deaminase/5-amino-6-(5-phosphoribosylamino)uracil reductase RibD [Phycicoccus sp. CSK15P-2]|uniref:bifunctional diaminohydroxyphosphoribosylaminopyrimidine deaminase/5-amino-6-(5-phosphoribosylamino)uracil reductase RibD n=1 Tax=Phycicoccus sp. CSK15P-2 TaxID=2807627 RepID=UPI0019501F80|nr:bifunctional diaminohydroxyphosphoribosylaminopyrimidine deaminase/5-amino-6-(5-phosphoribosylamino)uracil reductase RibD [Phycicoccus sp. CSK15P-2]MBM6403760.1 bifunctional diaminohydroxyphosphoribosylaminopyrimidine deaminase/5-amino-6-(5-phosphoribosylamino)uracil reductase RibD [Phycicoccus sp. CSK15P-2]